MKLEEQGLIKSIELPDGWIELRKLAFEKSVLKFSPAQDSSVKIRFHSRKRPIGSGQALVFRQLLSRTGLIEIAEIRKLNFMLGELAEPEFFKISAASTRVINGKSLLAIECLNLKDRTLNCCMFYDAGDKGHMIGEIFYIAPESKYRNHFDELECCLNSIIWLEQNPEEALHSPICHN